jgi:hypothetical protein
MPMPKGKVKLYKSDGKSLEFIGEDVINHTPKGEKLKLKVGDTFDIVAKETLIESKKISDNVYEYKYQIILKNRKDEDITVECEKYFWFVVGDNRGNNEAREKKCSNNYLQSSC